MIRPPASVRLLVVDDHPFVRAGLCAFLRQRPGLAVVGEAGDATSAFKLARRLRPDLVLMDVNLPGVGGLAATETLRRELPAIRVIIVSVHTQMEYILRMIRAGAHGFVPKSAPPAELARAIRKVAQGGTHFSREAALAFLQDQVAAPHAPVEAGPDQLPKRAREVLELVADGRTNKQMAAQLRVSVRTIETHRERLKRRLGLRTVAELTRFAVAHGLAPARAERR